MPPARLSKILFVSSWLKESAAWAGNDRRCDVLYNPVEQPCSGEDLRSDLKIGKEIFVFGRVGRNADDIHDPISLKAYRSVQTDRTLFLILGAPPKMRREAEAMGIKRALYLEPSTDDLFLSRFYNTIDALSHARADGETFGCSIAEAMIHGKPVITHRSTLRNAQAELVDESCGFVAAEGDWRGYAGAMERFMKDADLPTRMGRAARKKAMENFEAGLIVRKLESLYLEELRSKKVLA